jgi:hypothetical protein
MEHLFDSVTCSICGGTMTKISDTEAVCTSDERHRRKIRRVGEINILPFDSSGAGGVSLAVYDGID